MRDLAYLYTQVVTINYALERTQSAQLAPIDRLVNHANIYYANVDCEAEQG